MAPTNTGSFFILKIRLIHHNPSVVDLTTPSELAYIESGYAALEEDLNDSRSLIRAHLEQSYGIPNVQVGELVKLQVDGGMRIYLEVFLRPSTACGFSLFSERVESGRVAVDMEQILKRNFSMGFRGLVEILPCSDEEDSSSWARTSAYLAEEDKAEKIPSLLSTSLTYVYKLFVDREDSLPTDLMKLLRAIGCGDKLNRVLCPKEGNALHYALRKFRQDYVTMIFYLGDWAQLRAGTIRTNVKKGFNPRRGLENHIMDAIGLKTLHFFDSLDKKFMAMSDLSMMCLTGRLHVVTRLVETDPNILATSSEAIINACASGHHTVVDYMLTQKKELTVDIPGLDKCSQYAAIYDHPNVSQVLRDHEMDMIGPRKQSGLDAGLNAVDYHVRNDDKESLQFLVEGQSYQVDEQSIVTAIKYKKKRIIKYLLPMTKFVTDSSTLNPALVEAVRQDDSDTLKELLSSTYNRDLCKTDGEGMNLIHLAAKDNRLLVLKFLLSRPEKDSLINVQDTYHNSLGYVLVRGRDRGRLGWHYVLVDREKKPTFDKKMKTGEIDVKDFGHVLFSGFGAEPNEEIKDKVAKKVEETKDKQHLDMTPLHHACMYEHREAVDMLLTYGADPKTQDWTGCTPMQLASCNGNWSLVMRLLKAGGELTTKNKNGSNAEKVASDIDDKEIRNYMCGREELIMSETFLRKNINDVICELSESVLMAKRSKGEDIRKHLIAVLRNLTIDINCLLLKLGSVPVTECSI